MGTILDTFDLMGAIAYLTEQLVRMQIFGGISIVAEVDQNDKSHKINYLPMDMGWRRDSCRTQLDYRRGGWGKGRAVE